MALIGLYNTASGAWLGISGPAAAVDETSPMARAMSSALNSMSASFGLPAVSPPSHSGKISSASVSSSLGVLNTELYRSASMFAICRGQVMMLLARLMRGPMPVSTLLYFLA